VLNSNVSPTCSYNTVNFGPLAVEIGSLVWGTTANFNGFRVLAALLHDTLEWASPKLCGVEQRAPPIFDRAAITLGIGILVMAALRSRCGDYIFVLFLLLLSLFLA